MTTANPYQTPDSNLAAGGNDYLNLSPFTAKGRLGRIRYLAYSMGLGLAMYAAVLVIMLIGGGTALLTGGDEAGAASLGLMGLLLIPLYIGMLVITFLLLIKRSHDIGWSGWMSLLALIPLVGLLFIFVPGTKGSNEYGAQTPPNGVGVTIAGLALPVIALIGILAAIAIPAYMGYSQRAAMNELGSQGEAMPADMAAPTDGAILPAQEADETMAPADAGGEMPADQMPAAEDLPVEAPAEEPVEGEEQPQ